MRLIDADAFEQEFHSKILPVLIKRYGEEEAIRGLHFSFRDCICNIQAQPTIKPKPCEDCISRQAVIDVVRKCRVIEVTPAHMLIDKAEVMTELMMLPSAQPEQRSFSCSQENDLISRKAAIDAIEEVDRYHQNKNKDMVFGANSSEHQAWYKADDIYKTLEALPSAQPEACEDAVSRRAVVSRIADLIALELEGNTPTWNEVYRAVGELTPAQPEQRWIPWDSGEFPEESGTYTVTAYDGATKRVTYAKYQKRLKRWELTGARAYWRVLAWMPLPEPWKEGEQE